MAACDDAVDSALGHLGFIYIYGYSSSTAAKKSLRSDGKLHIAYSTL